MQEIQNIGEFNFAQTVEEKRIILEKLISDNQISEEDIKELQYTLFSCIKSIDSYQSGCNYYVKVDNPKDFYRMTGIGETNKLIQNMIDSIKPIYYIVVDDGIGTLKRKNILSKDIEFSNYFTKFV